MAGSVSIAGSVSAPSHRVVTPRPAHALSCLTAGVPRRHRRPAHALSCLMAGVPCRRRRPAHALSCLTTGVPRRRRPAPCPRAARAAAARHPHGAHSHGSDGEAYHRPPPHGERPIRKAFLVRRPASMVRATESGVVLPCGTAAAGSASLCWSTSSAWRGWCSAWCSSRAATSASVSTAPSGASFRSSGRRYRRRRRPAGDRHERRRRCRAGEGRPLDPIRLAPPSSMLSGLAGAVVLDVTLLLTFGPSASSVR